MKNNTKKILALSVLGMFMFVFAFSIISAQIGPPTAAEAAEASFFKDNPIASMFADWSGGEEFSGNISKYLFWVILSIIIYGISDMIPGLTGKGKEGLRWGFAIIVGFLSMAYITPGEIMVLMSTYSALGFTIGIGIPFVVLAAFTYKLASDQGENQVFHKFLAQGLWIIFSVFLIYKLFDLASAVTASGFIKTMIVILLIASVIMALFIKKLFKKVGEATTQGDLDKLRTKTKKSAAVVNARVEELEDIATAP